MITLAVPCKFSLFFTFIFFFFTYTASSTEICKPSSCSKSGPSIRFPFRLKDNQPEHCGYPGFDLSCNNQGQTILSLPETGDFILTWIDYRSQAIYLNTEDCLAEKILKFNLSGSPFRSSDPMTYTFLNCSSIDMTLQAVFVPCLSGDNYTVVAVSPTWFSVNNENSNMSQSCRNISTVSLPLQMSIADLELIWVAPRCRNCEFRGLTCGYTNQTELKIGCFRSLSRGLPRGAKYGIIIGAAIPGLVCMIGLASYIWSKIKHFGSHQNTELSTSTTTVTPHPMVVINGLDGPTIASFPKTILGESCRLPKPNDGTCAICLTEYEPKDTLRTIPACNHYFHANCIDEWLCLNATCPVCRNSPDSSSVYTSSLSMSSISPPSPSFSR